VTELRWRIKLRWQNYGNYGDSALNWQERQCKLHHGAMARLARFIVPGIPI